MRRQPRDFPSFMVESTAANSLQGRDFVAHHPRSAEVRSLRRRADPLQGAVGYGHCEWAARPQSIAVKAPGAVAHDFERQTALRHRKGRRRTLYVHRLIAMAWHADTYFAGAEVNHINGNPRDNRADNLEWVTHRQNILHSYRTLQTPRKRPQTGHGRRLDHGRRKAWHPVKGA